MAERLIPTGPNVSCLVKAWIGFALRYLDVVVCWRGVDSAVILIKFLLSAALSRLDDSCRDGLPVGDWGHFGVVAIGSGLSTSIVWVTVTSDKLSDASTILAAESCGKCCPLSSADNVTHSYISWNMGSWSVSNW